MSHISSIRFFSPCICHDAFLEVPPAAFHCNQQGIAKHRRPSPTTLRRHRWPTPKSTAFACNTDTRKAAAVVAVGKPKSEDSENLVDVKGFFQHQGSKVLTLEKM